MEFSDDYVVFDLETTGLSSDVAEIIEIAGLKICRGEIVEEFNELIKPTQPINEFITDLTGITNFMVENKGNISIVGEKFSSFVGDHIVVAHNANFDINFIYDNFLDHNIGIFNNDFIDTLRLARCLVKDCKNHKLQTLVEYFKFEEIGYHRAMVDTINTHKLLVELKEIHKKNPDSFTKTNQADKAQDLSLLNNKTQLADNDKSNHFYNLNVCFTGNMNILTKEEAGQLILNQGGQIQGNVTVQTDVLILGDVEEQIKKYGSISTKHKKAQNMQEKGHKIIVMEEKEMLDLLIV